MNEDELIEAGKAARAQGDFTLAASLYKQALKINPDNLSLVRRLGSLLCAQSDYKAAATVYGNAISRLEDQNEWGETLGNFYLSLGVVYTSLNRFQEAQTQFARASQVSADEILLCESRGNGYLAMGQLDKALTDFENYIQLDPHSPDGYIGKARVYQCKQKYDLAAEALRVAKTLDPDNYWVEVALGNLADDRADYPTSLAHYQTARLLKPESLEVKYNIGAAHLDLEQYVAAKEIFSELLKQSPKDPQPLAGLARVEECLGNERQAIALFKAAIVADPLNVSYYAGLSHVQVAAGRIGDAIRTAFQGRKVRLSQLKL